MTSEHWGTNKDLRIKEGPTSLKAYPDRYYIRLILHNGAHLKLLQWYGSWEKAVECALEVIKADEAKGFYIVREVREEISSFIMVDEMFQHTCKNQE